VTSQVPLSIALVLATPGTGWGGLETHTAELAQALAGIGHQVHVFAHRDYGPRFADRIRFHPTPFQWGRRNLLLRFNLQRALHKLQPDVVHAQGSKAAGLVSVTCPASAVSLGSVHGTKSSHREFKRLGGVIGVSTDIAQSIDHPNTRLIYNGRSLPQPKSGNARSDHPIPDVEPFIIAVGRLEPVKQFDRLIRAWTQADVGGRLVILGEGGQRGNLEQLISSLGVDNRIEMPGYESNILPWLLRATACVISSSREGFPYILIESLMAGCPVLSTPVSGVGEFLPPQAISASSTPDDLAGLLKSSLSQPHRLKKSQHDCFEKARLELSLDGMVAKTEAFYQDLLANRPAKL
jgi:glycosyltransferase involved in cell wall biosynthesis